MSYLNVINFDVFKSGDLDECAGKLFRGLLKSFYNNFTIQQLLLIIQKNH